MVTDNGIAVCLDAASGARLWRERLKGSYRASLATIGDSIYLTNTDGMTTVIAAERQYRKLGENILNEGIYASFAPTQDHLFIRTERHLVRVDYPEDPTRSTVALGSGG